MGSYIACNRRTLNIHCKEKGGVVHLDREFDSGRLSDCFRRCGVGVFAQPYSTKAGVFANLSNNAVGLGLLRCLSTGLRNSPSMVSPSQ